MEVKIIVIDISIVLPYNRSKKNNKGGGEPMYFWDKHKTITTYYELLSGEVCDRYGLTQMEYDILMFLHNNPQYNTAAEIVKIRKSTKSHVSTSLKNLESKGLVERIQSKDNKKHIEIALLDQAEIIIEAGLNAQKQFARLHQQIFLGMRASTNTAARR